MVRHWGVWNDVKGWYCYAGVVFFTKSVAIAEANCDMFNREIDRLNKDFERRDIQQRHSKYRVRCIEDWHAEKNDTLEALDA